MAACSASPPRPRATTPLEHSRGVLIVSGDSLTGTCRISRQDRRCHRAYTDGTPILGTGTRSALGRGGENGMVQPQPLYVGERVRTIVYIAELPAGMHGIVRA